MKKKTNPFLRILFLLFLVFIFLYLLVNTGYYESKIAKKTLITDKKIKQFERDVKMGKPIDLDSYYEEEKDYSSIVSKAGKQITGKLSIGLESFFKNSGKVLKKLFW